MLVSMPSKSDRLVALQLARQRRLDELIRRRRRTGQRQQLRHPLTLVHAARFGADLGVGLPQERIVRREIEPKRPSRAVGLIAPRRRPG